MSPKHLLFVYNADSGWFNTVADIGHKLLSPQTYACDLCALTHGYFSEHKAWRAIVDALPLPCEFLHRDEFRARYPQLISELPAVFVIEDAVPKPCLDATALAQCASLEDLQQALASHCLKDTA